MKSCGNCVNCDRLRDGTLCCEVYGFIHGYCGPANVSPPHDKACEYWSDKTRIDVDEMFMSYGDIDYDDDDEIDDDDEEV